MKEYLMVVRCSDEEYASMVSGYEVLNHIDWQDCSDEEIEVYKIGFGKEPEKLEVHGTWHNFDDPLYIKVTDKDGNIEFDGYGTDH